MRYLSPAIKRDLAKKAILLSGPRQVGKSTLAKSFLGEDGVYLNYDVREDKRLIHAAAWPRDASLVVLDELHKYPKWKNYLKGLIDAHGNRPRLLVTGSAKLDVLRRAGDPLTGRTYRYRLHPIDLEESRTFDKKSSREKRLARLMETGGFPEAFLNPADASRLRNDRLDFVVREDLRDLSRSSSVGAISLLLELLRERTGGVVSYTNLSRDLSVSVPTVKSWIQLLERLYLVFLVYPYYRGFARSIRKEPKVFFYDCGAGYEPAGRLENLVASALLKYCHFQTDTSGKRHHLSYFRDRDGHEVDFVVLEETKVKWCIEVKSADDRPHPSLAYLAERTRPVKTVQLVLNLDRNKQFGRIQVHDLGAWMEKISSH